MALTEKENCHSI